MRTLSFLGLQDYTHILINREHIYEIHNSLYTCESKYRTLCVYIYIYRQRTNRTKYMYINLCIELALSLSLLLCNDYHYQYLYMNSVRPLVNIHIAMENHHVLLDNSLSISMVIFNDKQLVYQRVSIYTHIYIYIYNVGSPSYKLTYTPQQL